MFEMFRKKRVYLDHASATPLLPEAARAVARAAASFGNPGALHAEAVAAKRILADARENIARSLGCKARELIFTSGLTEANNLAILGLARKMEMGGTDLSDTHWIVSSIEHASVLECFAEIERLGGKVSHVDPKASGIIDPDSVARALRRETVLVSIGWGNNEIGTVQPLSAIAQKIREHEQSSGTVVIFHTDAGQAPLYRSPQVHSLGVDAFSFSSGKLYGPRGIGALYISNKVALAPIVMGGGQERGLRAGTEEPALAAGFSEALHIIDREREGEARRLQHMRDDLAKRIVAQFPDVRINGDLKYSLPHMLNISIPDINAEYLVFALDREGIALSTKSACDEGNKESHVVAALPTGRQGLALDASDGWRAENTLRISLGRGTTSADIDRAYSALVRCIQRPAAKDIRE